MKEIMMLGFDKTVSSKEVAAHPRDNLNLNGIKASVRTGNYSNGSTIYVDLKDEDLTDDEIKDVRQFCRGFEDTQGCFPNRHVMVTVNGSQLKGKGRL